MENNSLGLHLDDEDGPKAFCLCFKGKAAVYGVAIFYFWSNLYIFSSGCGILCVRGSLMVTFWLVNEHSSGERKSIF